MKSLACCVTVEQGWKKVLVPDTPLRALIRNCPGGAKLALDKMFQRRSMNDTDDNQEVDVDYSFLDDALQFQVVKKGKSKS